MPHDNAPIGVLLRPPETLRHQGQFLHAKRDQPGPGCPPRQRRRINHEEDETWRGGGDGHPILVVKMIEIGLITPPVGLNVYVLKGVLPDVSTEDIFRGVLPFLLVQIVNVVVILLFPPIVLWLPRMMLGR